MSDEFEVSVFVDAEPPTVRGLVRDLRSSDKALGLELNDNESVFRSFGMFRHLARTLKDIPHGFVRLSIVIIYAALIPAILLIWILSALYGLVSPRGTPVDKPARFVLTMRSDTQAAVFSAFQLVEQRLAHPFVASVSSPLRGEEEHASPQRITREALRGASSLHALPAHMRVEADSEGRVT